jgi:hypothetical protein
VTTGSSGNLWRRFEHDPRDPTYAGMRASDRDRAVVHDVLADAYAEGRIDRDELDERTGQVDAAKSYRELLPPIEDLMADAVPARFAAAPPEDLRREAEQYYRDKLRETFFEFLIPNLICWAIWFMTGHDYFIWPVFVTIPTLLHLLQVGGNKRRTIEGRIEKLERKQAKALEPPRSKSTKSTKSTKSAKSPEQEKSEEA